MVDIKKIQENGIEIIDVIGEVDASSSIKLDKAIKDSIDTGYTKIVVDCSNLEYISSAGLGVFMSYIEEMRKSDVKIIISGLSEKVNNVFQILGLDQLLTLVKNRQEAKDTLNEL
ncbi:MAG: STAS domain-containing protein [Cyclobacteriaceae bacterium]|nr:STAS domain-containing protein [Cyclobacteriaceae bacterium]